MLRFDVLYFAYGSNLDSESWMRWCETRGYAPASIEALGPAWLPDHELVFHYRSRLRKGGALDLRPLRGSTIPGALFRVHDWEALDAKEGVSGGYYRRVPVTALTDDGRAHAATAYRVCDARIGDFVAPEPDYQEMVLRGLTRFGHGHAAFVAAAHGAPAPMRPAEIFAYGTLMSGEPSHHLLAPRVRRAHGAAQVLGASLVQLDWYPGLILRGGDGTVHGELYELGDVAAALGELDSYEDFAGYDREHSLYRRSLVSAVTSGGPRLAWTYVYLGDVDGRSVIPSGRWSSA
ncbi:MAG: gamma-glutamylcyclotransferase [Polyangiales bacterium]